MKRRSFMSLTAVLGLLGLGNVQKLFATELGDGKFTVLLGKYNGTVGDKRVYKFDPEKVFAEDSAFMRKLNAGKIYGEYVNPKQLPNEDHRTYINRTSSIELTNVSFKIHSIKVVKTEEPDIGFGVPIKVYGLISLTDKKNKAVKKILKTIPEEKQFMLRGFSVRDRITETGVVVEEIKQIITWDLGSNYNVS